MEETPSNNHQETPVPKVETPATNPGGSGDPSPPSITSSRTTVETLTANQPATADHPIAATAAEPAAKRHRGRPPGSKNKPKAAPFVQVYPNALRIHLLQVPSGADVNSSLYAYARDRRTGLAVLHATGSLTGCVNFAHTGPIKATRFDIVSLRGTIIPDETIGAPSGLTLFVSSSIGPGMCCEKGGVVNGPMVASGPVLVTVGSFAVTAVERLELPGEIRVSDPAGPGSGYNRVYSSVNMGMVNYTGGGHNGNFQYPAFQAQQQNGGS